MKRWKKVLCLFLAGLLVSQSIGVDGVGAARVEKNAKAMITAYEDDWDDEGDYDDDYPDDEGYYDDGDDSDYDSDDSGDSDYDYGDDSDDDSEDAYMQFTKSEITVGEFDYIDLNDYMEIYGCSVESWESSDESVASVSYDGIVDGKKPGTAVISATNGENNTVSCTVNVVRGNISITKSKTVKIGNPATLFITPIRYRTHVKWTSSNKKVATVDKYGKVTAQKSGTCTITATYGDQKRTCKITVPKVKLKLNAKKITLRYTNNKNLKVSTNLDKKLIKWKTSNAKVAKIAKSGKIIPMGAGTCKITAYYKKYKASCTVKIPSSVVKVAAPKKLSTKQDVYYDYIKKHGIQGGDCSSLKVDWSKVPNVSGYEVTLYWEEFVETTIKSKQKVNIIKEKGKYYYSTSCNYIYKTVKDLGIRKTWPTYFWSKKLSFCVFGGSCEGVYKVSVRSYRYVNGKKFYSKTKSKKA